MNDNLEETAQEPQAPLETTPEDAVPLEEPVTDELQAPTDETAAEESPDQL